MKGTFEQHLTNLNRDAQEMFDKLVKQLAESEGITEELKTSDQIAWFGKMENIHNRAMEIVNSELIYN